MTEVPNKFPTISAPYRLAIIGEAPGRDEELRGEPFVGASGRFLSQLMSRAGLSREACFIGNVCQVKPPANEIAKFRWDGDEIQHGIEQLTADLKTFDPNLCLLLGATALKLAKDPASVHALIPKLFKFKMKSWRGTIFPGVEGPLANYKCLASYHPAHCLRNYEWTPILTFDLKRAYKESLVKEIKYPSRNAIIHLTADEILLRLQSIEQNLTPFTTDIEGGIGTMSCVSIAPNHQESFVIPFVRDLVKVYDKKAKADEDKFHFEGVGNYWESEWDEVRVWAAFARVLANPRIKKTLQTSLYDRFVLQYGYRIPTLGVDDDTMLSGWELYCELPKSLSFQASILTEEPYYKFERLTEGLDTFLRYCCKDSMVTHEIKTKTLPQLNPTSLAHYRFNVSMLNPLLYMELRGIRYDRKKAKERRNNLLQQSYRLQHELNTITGHGLRGKNSHELEGECRAVMCYKRNPSQPKKEYVKTLEKALALCHDSNLYLRPDLMGELSVLAEAELNVDSPKQLSTYLYEILKLPTQYNDKDGVTTDYEALLKLKKYALEGTTNRRIVDLALEIRALNTRSGMLGIKSDSDGRIRCGYNVVGTETGRLTCYTSPTGSGYNLQTIPNYTKTADAPGGVLGDRDLFVADEGFHFFQCDLAGADSWTVAAHCKNLGDPTMLDDLLAGIKPAKVLCLGLRGKTQVLSPNYSRDLLKIDCESVKKEDWDYFACKIGIHGTSYLMGPILLARQIFQESEGKIDLKRSETEELKRLLFMRYRGITLWHQFSQRQINIKPVLVSASGHRRVFFGRKEDVLSQWLAHEPQSNTTYATNKAALNLWTDRDNRVASQGVSRLRIEPLHQVHDALCGQFAKEDTTWAVAKIKSYFDNPLMIAGQKITIPFEGLYGPSWGELGTKYGGGVI